MTSAAEVVVRRCRELAAFSEEPGVTTRTFLCGPMREVHALLSSWMTGLRMEVRVDAAGNLRGVYPALSASPDAPRLIIGSHLDSVPRAGAFDGVLGVVIAIGLLEALEGSRLPYAIEVVGFSEEEGVRFGVPFIGSRAVAGTVDEDLLSRRDRDGRSVADAIRAFGLDPATLPDAAARGSLVGYLEFHIEQGPVLERLGLPLGIVECIVGQSRAEAVFTGAAGHAGTTPMAGRRDALAAAAEWMTAVERHALNTPGLVATVGGLEVTPGAANVIPGRCSATLDVRHADDAVRRSAVETLSAAARGIAERRHIRLTWTERLDQEGVQMDSSLTATLERAVTLAGIPVHRLSSGAGHDAMIMASIMPAAMLFLRSPGGLSHHPDETVIEGDVAAALEAGRFFLGELARS